MREADEIARGFRESNAVCRPGSRRRNKAGARCARKLNGLHEHGRLMKSRARMCRPSVLRRRGFLIGRKPLLCVVSLVSPARPDGWELVRGATAVGRHLQLMGLMDLDALRARTGNSLSTVPRDSGGRTSVPPRVLRTEASVEDSRVGRRIGRSLKYVLSVQRL